MATELAASAINDDVELLLREQRLRQEAAFTVSAAPGRDHDAYRSGSAPPTVQGAFCALGSLDGSKAATVNVGDSGDQDLRSDPAYNRHCRSNMASNPWLPSSSLSKEQWMMKQWRCHELAFGETIGTGKMPGLVGEFNGSTSMGVEGFLENKAVCTDDGRHKGLADGFQDDLYHCSSAGLGQHSMTRNEADLLGGSALQFALHREAAALAGLHSNSKGQNIVGNDSLMSNAYASLFGSPVLGSASPDPEILRVLSPSLPPIGVKLNNNVSNINSSSPSSCQHTLSALEGNDDLLAAAVSRMSLSSSQLASGCVSDQCKINYDIQDVRKFLLDRQAEQNIGRSSSYLKNSAQGSLCVHDGGSTFGNLFSLEDSSIGLSYGSPRPGCRSPGASLLSRNGVTGLMSHDIIDNPMSAAALHTNLDPVYLQYLQAAEIAAQIASSCDIPPAERGHNGCSYTDIVGSQKSLLRSHNSLLGPLLQPQKQYGNFGNFSLGLEYPGSLISSSPLGSGSPLRHADHCLRYSSGMNNLGVGFSSWSSGAKLDSGFITSLLEEFKGNKSKSYELLDIAGNVVEFSMDQYGSRFIQQKLETASTEEKDMVFTEIMPQALTLMTDVFGNYVVQKFLEHGSPDQINELADQLIGRVLVLSLQMYGCRVIQKAIEVVGLDQQTKLVMELDGHVMRCVRDQNGNHVIQKCIECVPQHAIQFIISTFYGQVVMLSTHPYGCRVIQRVLEHCDDLKTQGIMMDEILSSVCLLAQDQYGNYVVQHVLEHGKPHERTAIIEKFIGQIVQMSQQKFASNVIEKCLAFGTPTERKTLITEMLGSAGDNEPLEAMMKDQFANYVVQKALETCEDHHREVILARIKAHLTTLKKYTYGKHIVARVEKLVAAGERRRGVQPSNSP